MLNCKLLCVCLAGAILGGTAHGASAQTFESVGVRAQGMSGAFVAVADDATASWWNPAGLATGSFLSAVIEGGQTTEPGTPSPRGPATRTTYGDVAFAFPSLGLSYYRVRASEIAGPDSTAVSAGNRQDPGTAGSIVRSVALSQFGATVGQSLGDHVVVGSTLKLVHAGAVIGFATGSSPLDDADGFDVSGQTRASVDLGAMADMGQMRLGLTVRNVTEPSFGKEGVDRLTLKRQARVGFAVLTVPQGGQRGLTVAADADITTTDTAVGEVRHVASGVEGWLAKGRLGLRAGASANTVGERRPSVSGGVSVRLTPAFRWNASATTGRDESVTGWSMSASVAF